MKDFLKTTLAVITGCLITGMVTTLIFFGIVGAIASIGSSRPVMPSSAVLRIDMSAIQLGEQTKDMDMISNISGRQSNVIGILDAVRAIEAAAADPAVRFIYLKPDMTFGGMAEIEELRQALVGFRKSGKAVISYIENPTTAGYYLASASDKIYMTPHQGGMNMVTGISSQMIFLKDILDRLGVNVQLIRHGKYKSAGEMFVRSEASPENLDQNKELVDAIWSSWTSEIAAGREISAEEFNRCLDDLELNSPEDYAEAGLVDELLTLDGLKARLEEYAGSPDSGKASMISLRDYAVLKTVPDFRADKEIAVIFAAGNIVDGTDNQQVAGDRFAEIISKVRKDDKVKAVVFRINSPGGSVLAAEKIRDEISLLAEEKPVIASFGDYAASGGYWVSAGCDYIYTNNSTLTGSIGVFSMIPDFSRTLDDIANVNVTSVSSNGHGDMYSMLRPLSDKEVAYMQESVENIYGRFTEIVAEGRSLEREYVDSVAQGRVWSGYDAVRLGLADQTGTLMDAIRHAAMAYDSGAAAPDLSQWRIVEYPKPLTTLELLVQSLNSSASASVFKDTPLAGIEMAFKDWSADRSGKVYARMPYELSIR